MAGLLFKLPLHFTDLNTARALIYGVYIAHIKLPLGSLSLTHGRKSLVAAGGVDWGACCHQQGVKTRRASRSQWHMEVFGSLGSDKSVPTPSVSH